MFRDYHTMLWVTLLFTGITAASNGVDTSRVLSDSALAILTDARCAEVKTETVSEITCFLAFPDTVPKLFYEVNKSTGELIIKLLNCKAGDFILKDETQPVNQGPVTSMTIREEILNKNEAMPSLTPEWYSVVFVTLTCHPMIRRQEDIVVSEMGNAITISFPWPDKPSKRKKYYTLINKPRRTALISSLIGVGTVGLAGGGYLAYKRYFSDEAKQDAPLEPVLPEHPSTP